jgi:hypothetical protein
MSRLPVSNRNPTTTRTHRRHFLHHAPQRSGVLIAHGFGDTGYGHAAALQQLAGALHFDAVDQGLGDMPVALCAWQLRARDHIEMQNACARAARVGGSASAA